MPFTRMFRVRRTTQVILQVVCSAAFAATAHPQTTQVVTVQPNTAPVRDNLAIAIDEIKRDNWAYVDILVKEAGPERAIPILQDLFTQSQDVDTKASIASKLVKLGDKDDTYWRFVVDQAREPIEGDIPLAVSFDAEGKHTPDSSPEFTAWAKAHNLSPEETAQAAFNTVYPLKLGVLANTGDPRAIPLLRRGLLARNFMVEAGSAMGLAILKDRDSIPLIVEACKRAPAWAKGAIAMSLLQFNDPEAQNAAEPYLPKELVDALHEKKQ